METLEKAILSGLGISDPYVIDVPKQKNKGSSTGEKELLTNLLNARDRRISDIMIPRADIFAIDETTPLKKLAALMGKTGHSRVPVFRKTLDDVIGFVHIKDVTAGLVDDKPVLIPHIVRKLLYVPPSMPVTRLLLQMRQKRQHMALVVDEFGGIDGLVTIEDVVEEIVGDIDDEHDDPANVIQLQRRADGSIVVDARMPIDAFEEQIGSILQEEERQAIDTLGGLVFTLAGRVPLKGENLRHTSGISFEVLEADTRRIKRLRVHNVPKSDGLVDNAAPLTASV
ncbi:MAG: HlyC/CorC family transporter [Alphaproteobacteria bacterium]|nr:HlyC/CorC family transporter [Alphaproteobacteria bacterium]